MVTDSCLHHLWGFDKGLTCTRPEGHADAHVMAAGSVNQLNDTEARQEAQA